MDWERKKRSCRIQRRKSIRFETDCTTWNCNSNNSFLIDTVPFTANTRPTTRSLRMTHEIELQIHLGWSIYPYGPVRRALTFPVSANFDGLVSQSSSLEDTMIFLKSTTSLFVQTSDEYGNYMDRCVLIDFRDCAEIFHADISLKLQINTNSGWSWVENHVDGTNFFIREMKKYWDTNKNISIEKIRK